MASLIQELENNEALLMMYLADELPPDDRLEVEQMLADDAGLRAEWLEIRHACDNAMGVLARLDADRSAVPAENHAVRQAMRAMKQWQVDRLARQPVLMIAPSKHIPIWAYPLASAAALLIGTIAWWGFGGQFHSSGQAPTFASTGSDPSLTGPVLPGTALPGSVVPGATVLESGASRVAPAIPAHPPSAEELTADRLDDSLNTDAPAGDSAGDSAGGITDAERQASSLIARSDSASVTSEIFLTEANP